MPPHRQSDATSNASLGRLAVVGILSVVAIYEFEWSKGVFDAFGSRPADETPCLWTLIVWRLSALWAVCRLAARRQGGLEALGFVRPHKPADAVGTAIVIVSAWAISTLITKCFKPGVAGVAVVSSQTESDAAYALASGLLVMVVGPGYEEVVYRAYMLQGVRGSGMRLLGMTASSLMFGATHLYDGSRGMWFATVWGAVLSVCFAWRGNVWPLIVGHLLWNVLATVGDAG